MPKTFLKKSAGWTEIKSIFVKKTTGWAEVKNVFLKKSTGWVKVFTKASLPDTTTAPSIRTTNTGSGTIYDGPVATSPQYLNEDLFGKDGVYTNYTSIFGRKFTRGSTSSALTRTTIVNDDRFTSAGGVTTAMRQACDEQYLFYELTVQNGSAANEIYPISPAIKMIKSQPFSNSFTTSGSVQVGATLTANIDIEYYYYNRPELSLSYVKWYVGNYAGDTSGTPVRTTSLSSAQVSTSSSAYVGSDTLYVDASYLGKYITLLLFAESSWTRHNSWATSTYSLDFAYAGDGNPVSGALSFSNIQVKDEYDRKGLDNRDRWPTDTINQYTGVLNGYDASTVIRIRYRIYNYDTGLYWKPSTVTQTTASAAWDSWTSDGSGNGLISDVSVSGSTATFYDFFTLDPYFNGGGSGPTWWLEIELSAIKAGGTRVYYVNPYETYYISKAIDSTISVSPATISPGESVTISGQLNGYPATPSTNGYPRQYKVDYGDETNSGWLPSGEYAYGTLNPTYSLTKTYSTGGTYTVSVDTIPYYEISTATVSVVSAPGAFSYSISDSTVTPGTPSVYSNTFSGTTISYDWPDTTNTTSWQSSISGGPEGSRSNARTVSNDFWSVTGGNSYTTSVYSINDSKQATISWTSSTGAGSYYVVYINNGAVGTQTVTGNSITVSTTGLVQISSVRAYANADGTGLSTLGSLSGSSSVTPTSKTSGTRTVGPDTAPTVSYTVTWNANGGSVSPTSSTGTSGSSVTAPTPTRSGYSFNGWYNASSGGSFIVGGGSSYTLSANVTLYAQWTSNFTPPSSPAPSWSSASNFSRKTTSPTHLQWFTDYPTLSGDGSFASMQFEIRTTAGGGTLLASGTRAFPGYGTYPYSAGGTIWAFRMGTTDGDITYSSSARYGRVRTVMTGTDGLTYYGTWSAWI